MLWMFTQILGHLTPSCSRQESEEQETVAAILSPQGNQHKDNIERKMRAK